MAARCDRRLSRSVVKLSDGCVFACPPRLAENLEGGTVAHLAEVEVPGAGSGLHWEALAVGLSINGFLTGAFGLPATAARHAGLAQSVATAEASRRRGAKNG